MFTSFETLWWLTVSEYHIQNPSLFGLNVPASQASLWTNEDVNTECEEGESIGAMLSEP